MAGPPAKRAKSADHEHDIQGELKLESVLKYWLWHKQAMRASLAAAADFEEGGVEQDEPRNTNHSQDLHPAPTSCAGCGKAEAHLTPGEGPFQHGLYCAECWSAWEAEQAPPQERLPDQAHGHSLQEAQPASQAPAVGGGGGSQPACDASEAQEASPQQKAPALPLPRGVRGVLETRPPLAQCAGCGAVGLPCTTGQGSYEKSPFCETCWTTWNAAQAAAQPPPTQMSVPQWKDIPGPCEPTEQTTRAAGLGGTSDSATIACMGCGQPSYALVATKGPLGLRLLCGACGQAGPRFGHETSPPPVPSPPGNAQAWAPLQANAAPKPCMIPSGPVASMGATPPTPTAWDPLFPEYARSCHGPTSPLTVPPAVDKHRVDRWVRRLPDGSLPTDRIVLYWALTSPAGAPLLTTGKWSYVPKDSRPPNGVLLQFGHKRGSVHVWLRKGGHVHVQASVGVEDRILAKLEAWTVPWNNGSPPAPPRPGAGGQEGLPPLPPLPPADWSPPPAA
ncbi:unnamed protein product [Prorocentrum cordatum]|uniref:GATA-type domain-containing protein n=1 Tax=Prorocentrum cordatum TaxID=2364126 RepID=A0ABN9R4M0_9DINO|nr:unnamed protein product [Polarella glacialis]